MSRADLASEWHLHQTQFDSYEKHSLFIKLLNITLCAAALLLGAPALLLLLFVCLFWGVDGIWKTFQSRIDARLLLLEQALSLGTGTTPTEPGEELEAFQFNRDYLKNRPSFIGLLIEYAKQALRPTVAFPHAVLALVCVVFLVV